MTVTYAEALRYLFSFTDYERQRFAAYEPAFYNLDRLRRLLDWLGRPQDRFRAVQVAGSKGKGSTAAMLAAIIAAAGQRAGLYTSPHLHTYRERIRVNDRLIPEAGFARLVARMAPAVEAANAATPGNPLTTFEIATALAFLYYAEALVDVAVLEAGLGGTLDATNVVDPALSILTPVSLDHIAVLGNTLTAIAEKKAGIVKPGVPAVAAPQPAEALAVIQAACQERAAPLTLVGRDWTWTVRESTSAGLRFDVMGPGATYADLHTSLVGGFQAMNAATAVAAAAQLGIGEPAIREGLAGVRWPARLEILARQPWVVADGAHNGDSARKLAAALTEVFRPRRVVLVLGLSQGHHLDDILNALLPLVAHAVVTRARHPRAADPAAIQANLAARGHEAIAVEPVAQAMERALARAGPGDLVCATGSLFVAAEARAAFGAPGSELRDPVPY